MLKIIFSSPFLRKEFCESELEISFIGSYTLRARLVDNLTLGSAKKVPGIWGKACTSWKICYVAFLGEILSIGTRELWIVNLGRNTENMTEIS